MDLSVIFLNIAIWVFPLLVLFRRDVSSSYIGEGPFWRRGAFAVGLGVAYLVARLLFFLYYSLFFPGALNLQPHYEISASAGVGADLAYWLAIRYVDRHWKDEPYLWKATWYYFAEVFVIAAVWALLVSIFSASGLAP